MDNPPGWMSRLMTLHIPKEFERKFITQTRNFLEEQGRHKTNLEWQENKKWVGSLQWLGMGLGVEKGLLYG